MSRGKVFLRFSLLSLFFIPFTLASFAQNKDSDIDGWNFRISPYFWFIRFDGTIYNPPIPIIPSQPTESEPPYEIDISFQDIAPHLRFAFMAAGEYRYNRFVTQFNITSLILDGDAVTPLDYIFQDVFLHLGYVSGDLSLGHHFIMNDKLEIAGMGGLKFIYFNLKGSTSLVGKIDFAGERDVLWIDPIFGTRIKYKPYKRVELVTYADIGGFLSGDELNYQFIGTANYIVSKWFLLSVGYRLYSLKVDEDQAIYNGKIKGLVFRVGFQF